jgi:DNA helicase-2/ATP-dependent DNA helicase PcrA
LHSLCFRQLGLTSREVLQGPRLQEFAQYAGIRINGRFSDDGTFAGFEEGDRILFMENLARVHERSLRVQYDLDDDGLSWHKVQSVVRALENFKREEGLVDYTDMLKDFADMRAGVGLRCLFVDESQDLTPLQWRVVVNLAQGVQRMAVAGDDDQAIYVWAGADVGHMLALEGRRRVLAQSYRVPRAIQRVATGLIDDIHHRQPKQWAARDDEGIVDDQEDIYDVDVAKGTVLVLARNSYILDDIVAPSLRLQGFLFERHGHPSVKRSIVQAISAWEELRAGHAQPASVIREVYALTKHVKYGHRTLPRVDDDAMLTLDELTTAHGLETTAVWHDAFDGLPPAMRSYLLAIRKRGEKLLAAPRIRLSTIHGSKGGEADHVVLMLEMASRTQREMSHAPDDERRVWYVAATRAREQLTIVRSKTRQCPWL